MCDMVYVGETQYIYMHKRVIKIGDNLIALVIHLYDKDHSFNFRKTPMILYQHGVSTRFVVTVFLHQ